MGRFVTGPPGRKRTTYKTRKGLTTHNQATGKYSGPGTKPKGAKTERPSRGSVTVKSSGAVVSEGFEDPASARRAKRKVRRARRAVRRSDRRLAAGRAAKQRSGQRRQERPKPRKRKPVAVLSDGSKVPGPLEGLERHVPEAKLRQPAKKFLGKPVAGDQPLGELARAAGKGALRVNEKGHITTPSLRKAKRGLNKAERSAPKAEISGLDPDEERFVRTVAKGTGLSPRAVAAWTRQEGGNSTGDWNRLNIGHTDSGPIALTADPGWQDPEEAGKRTAAFLRGEYGGPSEGIRAILPRAKGKSPSQQLQAIAESGWATDPNYATNLQRVLAEVPAVKPNRQLRQARRVARREGLKVRPKAKALPKKVMTRFKAAVAAAGELEAADLPYVWGGGHGDPESRPTGGGLDCSGAVSYVLNKMGAMEGSLVSGDMGKVLKPGPGAVTVFYNPTHTFMRIGDRYFGTSRKNEGGGAGFIEGKPDDLSKYAVGHVPGMGKKVAVAMGVPLSGGGSFPGMSLSDSGTTATISEGAGATVGPDGKPGFSTKPIRLTRAQRARRTMRKLDQLGAGVGSDAEPEPEEGNALLSELERKYGAPAV